MNKRLLVGLFSAFMAMAPWSGNAAETQNIDAPHLNLTDGCENCHFAGLEPGDCTVRCHTSNIPPYNDTVAPVAVTHQNLACQACHNPHVSLQTGGITGAFGGVTYDAPSDRSTLTGVSPTPDPTWAAKTSAERGMILWVPDLDPNSVAQESSYEVKAIDATAGTVTVKGNMTTVSRTFELRRGQLIAKAVTKTVGESYKQGTIAVQFPASATQPFVDATNNNGICQVCHTATTHWKADGTGADHNATAACTSCHKHDSGFLVTGCNACHQGVGDDGVPVDMPGMAVPSTGSITAGQHQVHAVDYAFPCATCHVGTGMDRLNDPLHPIADGKIQIGFNWGKYLGYLTSYDGQTSVVYEGTNHTKVTNGGTMTCATVYCHSDGRPVRLNCATSTTNTTPKWDGSDITSSDPQGDAVKCNNCHGFETSAGSQNNITSGKHLLHAYSRKIACYVCHADTAGVLGGGPIVNAFGQSELINKSKHANTIYDIKGSGTWGTGNLPIVLDQTLAAGAAGKWDPVAKTCVTICHSPANRTSNNTWTATDTETCPDACVDLDGVPVKNDDPKVVSFTAEQISSNTVRYTSVVSDADNNDSVKALCLSGGHTGSSGRMRIQRSSGGKFANTVKFDGTPVVWDWVLSDKTTQINTVNFPYPVHYFHRIFMDNDPATTANLDPVKSYKNPLLAPYDGLVYGATDGIAWTSSFQYINWNPNFDDSQVNVLAVPKVTPVVVDLGGGNYQMTLTSEIVDPDAIDLAKNSLFGGHGHDGTVKVRVKAYWGGSSVSTVHRALPTDNVTPLVMETPMTYTYTGVGSGAQLWYFVSVFDSHREDPTSQAASPTAISDSGWMFYTVP